MDMQIIDELGYQGPAILNIVVGFEMWGRWLWFGTFFVGFWLNKWINEYLKAWIREPRPRTLDVSAVKSRDLMWRLFDLDITSPVHRWGMPSGHAQSVGFAVAFFYFMKEKKIQWMDKFDKDTLVFSGMVFLGFLTLCQRWLTEAHSIAQLVVGSLVGGFVAWVMVLLAKWVMVGYTKKPIKNI